MFAVLGTRAQVLLGPHEAEQVTPALNSADKRERLNCAVRPFGPFLDFSFRFEAGYTVTCPIRIFDGKPARAAAFMRVTPRGGKPVVLAESYNVPGIPPDLKDGTDIRKVKTNIGTSGVFAVGEGPYTVELILVDDRERMVRKKWDLKVRLGSFERDVHPSIPPNTVEPMAAHYWNGALARGDSNLRVTVLLDAAPIYPLSTKLRAWDRAFLLNSVTSLLSHLPCRQVKVVAFNLDQQRVVYQHTEFNREGFRELARSLQSLELGSVSYKVLQQQEGSAQLLTRLLNAELMASDPADMVVFLGPNNRLKDRVPKEMTQGGQGKRRPQLFYVEYFPLWSRGREFPDLIERLTDDYDGTTFKIHTPAELATAIQRMTKQLSLLRTPPKP
jgi:hypothetical protein